MIASYGNDIFYYYDSSINTQDDIYKQYGKDSNLTLLGKEDIKLKHILENVVNINLSHDGGISSNGKETLEYNQYNLHVGNVSNVDFGVEKDERNFFGYHYLGSDNPKINNRDSYSIAPINWQDYAAYKHDLAYDEQHAEGLIGVCSLRTTSADLDLILHSIVNAAYSTCNSKQQFISLATAGLFMKIVDIKTDPRTIFIKELHYCPEKISS